jgi:alpha-1,2-glucosyltransferase
MVADFLLTPFTLLPAALLRLPTLIGAMAAYTIPLQSFTLFLIYNNFTIVLGDASAHVASVHLPQLLYFTAATAFFSFPLLLPILPTLRLSPQGALCLFAAITSAAVAVKYNTILHPYLLADNRHYAFYVFRRLLLRFPPYSLLAPVPAYILAGWLQFRALTTVTTAWLILYAAATTATLVGAPLVEPRYFIIAWVVWRCHVGERRRKFLYAEMVWLLMVNAGTVAMFLYRDFEWAHERGVRQRFMW